MLTTLETIEVMEGLIAYVKHYNLTGEQKFQKVYLFIKLNEYLNQSNKDHFINPYKMFNMSGVELKNYISWKESNKLHKEAIQ